MACYRKRRGKWVVDWRDSAGVRHWATCVTRDEAKDVLAEKIRESRQPVPTGDPNMTLGQAFERYFRGEGKEAVPRQGPPHRRAPGRRVRQGHQALAITSGRIALYKDKRLAADSSGGRTPPAYRRTVPRRALTGRLALVRIRAGTRMGVRALQNQAGKEAQGRIRWLRSTRSARLHACRASKHPDILGV